MFRLLACLCLLAIPTPALALEATDVGTYAVIHRDGHVTGFTFFVSLTGTRWDVEQRQSDGAWANVTCERDCVLQESTRDDIARFFPAATLAEITPSCVHNSAFAFCDYRLRSRPGSKGYVFVALVRARPIPLGLKRLSGQRLAP